MVVWAVIVLLSVTVIPHHHHHHSACMITECNEAERGCPKEMPEENGCVARSRYLPKLGGEERSRTLLSEESEEVHLFLPFLFSYGVLPMVVPERTTARNLFPAVSDRILSCDLTSYGWRAPPE